MKIFTEKEEVCVSISALYEAFGEYLYDNTISITLKNEDGEEKIAYCDLINRKGYMVCCDGEACIVEKVEDDTIIFVNKVNGNDDLWFTLTKDEAVIGCFE